MRFHLLIFCIVVLFINTACANKQSARELLSDQAVVRVWGTSHYSQDNSSEIISGYGSKIIHIENQPVRLRVYHIDNGMKTLKGEMLIDPAITPFIAAHESIKHDKARIELLAPQVSLESGLTTSYLQVEAVFPMPTAFGCNTGGAGSYLPAREEEILTFWIQENESGEIKGVGHYNNIEVMIRTSSKIDASFVVITAEAE